MIFHNFPVPIFNVTRVFLLNFVQAGRVFATIRQIKDKGEEEAVWFVHKIALKSQHRFRRYAVYKSFVQHAEKKNYTCIWRLINTITFLCAWKFVHGHSLFPEVCIFLRKGFSLRRDVRPSKYILFACFLFWCLKNCRVQLLEGRLALTQG